MQNNSKFLDDIISSQKTHHDKFVLGYNQTKGIKLQNNRTRNISKIYAETIKGDMNIYKEYYMDTPPPRRF
jgi:hypothetical protein